MSYATRLNPADLRGRPAISYLRFSSSPQEKGSSIERQQERLDGILAHLGLVLDVALMDKALSASKGHHRKRGQLGDLLKLVKDGMIKPGTVLVIEAVDRLFREGLLDVFPIIADMIRGGLIIVTGDMSIYDEAAINGDLSHKLVAELNAAHNYTKRLSELATGAHAARRRKMEDLADNVEATKPILNSRPPGWIVRDGKAYTLHPAHAETVRLIYDMCLEGHSVRQIAYVLNQRKIPLMGEIRGDGLEWRSPRVGAILRDEHVLGFVQPCIRDGAKRIPRGRRVILYPPVIDAAVWVKVRELLNAKQNKLKGRKGSAVANLFTGHVFCATCNGAMRVDTGGHIRKNGSRQRILICARFMESKTCTDNTRYDLHYYELPLLFEIIQHASLVPHESSGTGKAIAEELAAKKIEMSGIASAMDALAPRLGTSPMLLDQFERMGKQHDSLRRDADDLTVKVLAATSDNRRVQETGAFLQSLVRPATIDGDLEARERLRSLMSRLEFKTTGNRGDIGGMLLWIGSRQIPIPPPGFIEIHDDEISDEDTTI
jgi:DNA invertase Pin-like site-specific DNA recombinase